MIDASHQVELFDDEFWCEPFRKIGIVTAKEPKIQKPIPKALEQLEALVEEALVLKKFPMVFEVCLAIPRTRAAAMPMPTAAETKL